MELVKIGKLLKSFGVDGHLRFYVNDKYMEDLKKSDVVFLSMNGEHIPYFIEEFSETKPHTIKFEEVDSKEMANKIGSCELNLRISDISIDLDEVETLDHELLVGYQLYNKSELLGEIENILEYPQQIMAVLSIKKCQVLIPLPFEFVININSDQKVLTCDLPDGIVESQLS